MPKKMPEKAHGKISEKVSQMPAQIDAETARKIQELQLLEQGLQNLMMQKQAFQLEVSETTNALSELRETKEEVYKIVSSIMLKAKRAELIKELERKKELLELRIKNIEKQEAMIRDKFLKKRSGIMQDLK